MFSEYVKYMENVFETASQNGILEQGVYIIIDALLALYLMSFALNNLVLSWDKKKVLIIFLSAPEAVYLLFYLSWLGCFVGRRERHFPLLLLAEFGVFLIMTKIVIRRQLNLQHKSGFR